jgi:broad specificity phosphatase PhoE
MRIVLIRHSRSCANHVRHLAGTEDRDHPLVKASQELRDPVLSSRGREMATTYGPELQAKLAGLGIDWKSALVGASPLRRAQQTAALLFPRAEVHTFQALGEHGAVPENTPRGRDYAAPNWPRFLEEIAKIAATQPHTRDFLVVGHGSFLRNVAWPAITGHAWPGTVHNLDAFVIDTATRKATRIHYTGAVKVHGEDRCALPPKIARHTRRMARAHKQTRKQRSQRGGGVSMPLAFFQNGAQMRGTYAEPTGVGLAQTTASMVRAPLGQFGGSLGGSRKQQRQAGGWSPSLMASFTQNGMRLVPVAAYMGYELWKKKPVGRQTRKQKQRKH